MRYRRRHVIPVAAAAVAVAVLGLATVTRALEGDGGAHKRLLEGSRQGGGDGDLSGAAAAIERYWRKRSAETFAGVAVDEARRRVIVYRLPAGAVLDRDVRRVASTDVVFRDAERSERELQELTAEVLRDIPYWHSRGIELASVGPEPKQGVVEVMTPDPEKARDELLSRYGSSVVVREGGPMVHVPYITSGS